ncbi:MAG: SIS domain-containing protein [Erysipelotrichaceae bacterium]|nr:SIS domain-containing protein [Erysipelotrichaceae bacterium]
MEEKRWTMKDYVEETPEAVLKNIDNSEELTKSLVDYYASKPFNRIVVIASGSSYNGSLCAREFVSKVLKKQVKVVNPFTFVHYENDVTEDDLVLVFSQSGRSTNSIEALEKIKEKGVKAIGVTGDVHSDFEDICDLVIDWGVGIEKVGYVTKGVVTLALYLMLFAVEAGKRTGVLTEEEAACWKNEMRRAMEAHKELQASAARYIESHEKVLMALKNVWLISAGSGLAVAIEGALKIGETVHIHASAYECEEFLHGPCYPFDPNYAVIAIDTNDSSSARINQIYEACKQVTDRAILITSQPTDDPEAITSKTVVNEMVMPLAYLAVCPLLANVASQEHTLGRNPLLTQFSKQLQTKSRKKPRQ